MTRQSAGSLALSFDVQAYPECVESLIAFRNRNRPIPRDRRYFDWRYQARPCAVPAAVLWAESGGRPVGALSVFPHDYYVLDGEYPLGVLGDISVDPEFRGQGVAGSMFRFLAATDLQRRLGGGIVLPNEEAARPLLKAGWLEANHIGRYVRILDVRPYLDRSCGRGRLASSLSWPLNAAIRLAPLEILARWQREKGFQSTVTTAVDARFDDLWRRCAKRGHVLAVRNAAYLRWRYERHPVNRYEIFTLTRGDELDGYVCYRLADGMCVVDDVFAAVNGATARELVRAFLEYLRQQRAAHAVTVNVNESYLNIPWRGFGFSRRADFQRVLVTGTGSGPGDRLTAAARTASWHVAAGDKDV